MAAQARVLLDGPDPGQRRIQRRGHGFVHQRRVVPFDEQRGPAVAAEQLLQLLAGDAGQHGRVGDLVAVEMQDRQDGAVGHRVEELVGVPGGRQRPGFRFAVADHAGDDQPGVVEHRPEGMAERIAQLAAFVDRSRALGGCVAGNAAGEGELDEELAQAGLVLADVRVDLAVAAFQVGVADHRRAAVPGAGDIDHVQVELLDHPVQVHVDEVLPRGRAPVAQQHVLHVRERKRTLQQRVVAEVDLADRQIVCRAPIGVHAGQQFGCECPGFHGATLP